jgi:hypothetical protein
MADLKFPRPVIESGHYDCVWFYRRRRYAGSVDLESRRWPQLHLYDDHSQEARVDFGAARQHSRLLGRLRNNMDVVVTNAGLFSWFPGQSIGRSGPALIGLGVAGVTEDRYDGLAVQMTGLDPFIGQPPVVSTRLPFRRTIGRTIEYGGTVRASGLKWRDRTEGVIAYAGYDSTAPMSQHGISVVFAPMIYIDSPRSPLTYSEWVERWLVPLQGLVTFAGGSSARVTLLTLTSGGGTGQIRAAVFGGGISQEPYTAEPRERWLLDDDRSYVVLAGSRRSFPSLLHRWRDLLQGDNPFLSVYAYALEHRDQPDRAAFLMRIQALEALQGYEGRRRDAIEARKYSRTRERLMRDLNQQGVAPATIRQVDRLVGRSPRASLAGSFKQLLDKLPKEFITHLDHSSLRPLVRRLRKTRTFGNGLHEELAAIRNGLSHGEAYPAEELAAWLRPVDLICRASLLRLLGYNAVEISAAMVDRPAR